MDQVERNFEQTKEQFSSVEEHISNLNQRLQTSNDELFKRISEVLEAVHSTTLEKTRSKEVSPTPVSTLPAYNISNHIPIPPLSPAQNYPPPSPSCSIQVMNTSHQNINKPYIPVSSHTTAFGIPHSSVSLNSSFTEPYARPVNLNSTPLINHRVPYHSVTSYPWLPYTDMNHTLGITSSLLGINSIVMSMPTHLLPTSSFINYNPPPINTTAYLWPPTIEANPVRPQSPILTLSMPKMDFPRFEGKDPKGWIKKYDKFF